MKRRTFDILISVAGLFLALVLVVAGGLLLNAYAFDTMGTIAGIAAVAAFVAAAVMLALGGLGLWHARRVPATAEIFARRDPAPDPSVSA
jgi:hypothetical protein